jgi:hypothetical protein
MVYRAKEKCWVLHINLLMLDSTKLALERFKTAFGAQDFGRPTQSVPLRDLPEQVSYLLKLYYLSSTAAAKRSCTRAGKAFERP